MQGGFSLKLVIVCCACVCVCVCVCDPLRHLAIHYACREQQTPKCHTSWASLQSRHTHTHTHTHTHMHTHTHTHTHTQFQSSHASLRLAFEVFPAADVWRVIPGLNTLWEAELQCAVCSMSWHLATPSFGHFNPQLRPGIGIIRATNRDYLGLCSWHQALWWLSGDPKKSKPDFN